MNSGDGDEQGGLVCHDSWGLKESDTTERLNQIELNICLVELGLILLTPLQMQKLMIRNFKKITQLADC